MKNLDFVDIILAIGFSATLAVICFLSTKGLIVPQLVETIFWSCAMGLGMKKLPQQLNK